MNRALSCSCKRSPNEYNKDTRYKSSKIVFMIFIYVVLNKNNEISQTPKLLLVHLAKNFRDKSSISYLPLSAALSLDFSVFLREPAQAASEWSPSKSGRGTCLSPAASAT